METASALAAFTIALGVIAMMMLWAFEVVGYEEGLIAMACMFAVMMVFGLVFNIAMEKASNAFRVHLDELRASKDKSPKHACQCGGSGCWVCDW